MRLKILCQICGHSTIMETGKPIGHEPRWENYELHEFEILSKDHPFNNYEIWICPDCHEKVIDHWDMEYDELGERYVFPEYDWEKITEMVRSSMLKEATVKEEMVKA